MAVDLYASCPCGSGKKFKWCCQPIHAEIEKAFRQDAEGQHEASLRTMEEVVAKNAGNPEAWGRKAQLLYQNDKVEEAENALQKAMDLNPNYAFGYLLRGLFRQHEGELAGALLCFRKAAELYDPEARSLLGQVYSLIGETELKLNRPVAGRAALKQLQRSQPNNPEIREALDQLFGDQSRMPLAARRDYAFKSPPSSAGQDRRTAWDRALSSATTGRLSDARRAFEQLTDQDPQDAAAWYNRGLVLAWLGENAAAVEALDRYVTLEPNEREAAPAWALAEVLRYGQGMEDSADVVEHSVTFQIRDPRRFFELLPALEQERRLLGIQVHEQEGVITGMLVERTSLVTGPAGPTGPAKFGAHLMVFGDILRIWSVNPDALERLRQELQQRAGASLSEPRSLRGPAQFGDALARALCFPAAGTGEEQARQQVREHIRHYFEDEWIHRPLKSLANVPPVDAAGHPVLRKKLEGVIEFLQSISLGATQAYEFDRLRRKLGLLAGEAKPAASAGAIGDIDAMGAAELAGLTVESLSAQQVESAYRAAHRLDAHDLAGHFARALIGRPPQAEQADRYPVYTYLIQRALAEGNTDAALQYVDEGEKYDCEQNEGRRRNDYELRRGQVLVKRGEADAGREVFQRLVERAPDDLKLRGTATEALLAGKQGAVALQLAEGGLAKARAKNDRDSEQYFLELVSAAKRQVG